LLVYIARHGEATHNPDHLFHDTTVPDVELTSKGIQQSAALAEELRAAKPEAIFVSELKRTRQTADIVNSIHNVPEIVDPLLNDIVSGIAGKPVNEFRTLLTNSADPWNAHFEGGESYNEVKARAELFLEKLKTMPYGCVLVVTSGGLANILYGLENGLSNEEMFNRPIENAALLSITI
jgi:broad specificity phosphatase PhoE